MQEWLPSPSAREDNAMRIFGRVAIMELSMPPGLAPRVGAGWRSGNASKQKPLLSVAARRYSLGNTASILVFSVAALNGLTM
jgi:hypothetical protein